MTIEKAQYPETEKLIRHARKLAKEVRQELKEIRFQLGLINREIDKYETFIQGKGDDAWRREVAEAEVAEAEVAERKEGK